MKSLCKVVLIVLILVFVAGSSCVRQSSKAVPVQATSTEIETPEKPAEEKIFAATVMSEAEGKLLHDTTCMWYYSDNVWYAMVFKEQDFVACHAYVTREELVRDIKRRYSKLPMNKAGEVTAEYVE